MFFASPHITFRPISLSRSDPVPGLVCSSQIFAHRRHGRPLGKKSQTAPLRAFRAGRSVRNRWRAQVFSEWTPHNSLPTEGSRDPARNLPLGLPHSGGILVCETSPTHCCVGNGGDWTEGLTRNRLEHSRLRRCYFSAALTFQTKGR